MRLTHLEEVWATAALTAIFPGSDAEGLASIDAMDVSGFLRDVMRRVPFRSALGLRVAIWLAAFAPLFAIGRFTTIARLSPGDRERTIGRLVASRWYAVRSLVLILRTIGALLYAGDNRVRSRMQRPRAPGLVSLRVKRVHGA